MAMSLEQDLKRLKKLKDDRDAKKARYEVADRTFKAKQAKVLERMEATEIESMRVAGTLFVPTETVYAKVQDAPEFIEWALDNDDSLIEYKGRKEVLNQLIREKLDNGEELPPGLTFYVREYISQRAG